MKRVWLSFLLLLTNVLQQTAAQKLPGLGPAKNFHEISRQVNAQYDAAGKKGAMYKQWKRMEWYFSTRLDANRKIPDMQNLKQAALQQAETLKASFQARTQGTLATTGNWTLVGPTTTNATDDGMGRVNRLAFHPTDANTLYAATAGGGLWKTSNGGTSWIPLTDGLPNMNLSGVAVHKTSPNTLYILTGDGDGAPGDAAASLGKFSTGVLKSTDGGTTWNYTGLKWKETDGILPYLLVMHPSNFNTLMAATNDGIWRTTNGGTTWTEVLLNETVYDIEFMPNNSLVVYAAAHGGRFFRSMDGGATWTNLYDNPNQFISRVSIAVTPDYGTGVYMLIASNGDSTKADSYTFNGLYYSSNNGDTWARKSFQMPNVFSGDGTNLFSGQQTYDHALVVSPFDKDLVLTGGVRLFRSTNGGSTFSFIDNNSPANYHVDVHDLVYSPLGSTLYAATDGGVYKSTNNGVSWTSINGNLAITQYYRLSVFNGNSNYVLAGAQDNGTHLRKTNTTAFDKAIGKDGMDNAISPSNSSIMYAAAQNGDYYFSTNSGTDFNRFVNENILEDDYSLSVQSFWVTPIDVSATNANVVFLGYYPLIRGIRGFTWLFHDIGYAGYNNPKVSGRTFVKTAPGNSNIIYAADNNYSFGVNFDNDVLMWRSSDGGEKWTRLHPGGADQPLITDLAMNPDDPKEIWVTAGNFIAGRKVYRSLDSGATWVNISGSLPNVPVNCIVYDDNNGSPNDALYIGTDIGVFYRDNNTGDWVPFSTGLPVVEVTDLEINESAGLLRASTYGRGIWQTSLYAGVCITNVSLTSHSPSEPHFYNAGSTITSTAAIAGAGAHIQYKAGDRVTLSPGFRIDAGSGARFIGYIGPCNGGGVPVTYRQGFNGLPGYLKE